MRLSGLCSEGSSWCICELEAHPDHTVEYTPKLGVAGTNRTSKSTSVRESGIGR